MWSFSHVKDFGEILKLSPSLEVPNHGWGRSDWWFFVSLDFCNFDDYCQKYLSICCDNPCWWGMCLWSNSSVCSAKVCLYQLPLTLVCSTLLSRTVLNVWRVLPVFGTSTGIVTCEFICTAGWQRWCFHPICLFLCYQNSSKRFGRIWMIFMK